MTTPQSMFSAVSDAVFPRLERLDDWLHERGFTVRRLCRLVGAMERGYYERGTDWAHPVYVKPPDDFDPDNRRRANRRLMEAFMAVWDTVPEQRFGQVFMNLSRMDGGFAVSAARFGLSRP